MQQREAKLYDEAVALWREMRQDPPPRGLDGPTLLSLILMQTRDIDYDRLLSPHLRETTLSRPVRKPDPDARA